MRRLTILAVALLAVAALVPGLAAPAYAQTGLPASLQGESFVAYTTTGVSQGSAEVNATCSGAEGTMTVAFRAEGIATGPYPGTFTESGTTKATLLAPLFGGNYASGTLIEWKSTFTITSLVGKVAGTKTLRAVVPSYAYCMKLPLSEDAQILAQLDYEATIKPSIGGTFSDQGEASAFSRHRCVYATAPCDVYEEETFFEWFTLSTGVLPLDTHGKATGGGQVLAGSNPLEGVTFGFNVRKDENETRLTGTCNVLDQATRVHVKCLTVSDYQQIGNTATWEGTAEVNGEREHYRITVQDNAEPNQGLDTFSIKTDTYEAAGNVEHGNVQLHKQELAGI